MIKSTADVLMEQGARRIVERVLRARFGELDDATLTQLEQAEANDLELWADRLLIAKKLSDVLSKPRRRRPRKS